MNTHKRAYHPILGTGLSGRTGVLMGKWCEQLRSNAPGVNTSAWFVWDSGCPARKGELIPPHPPGQGWGMKGWVERDNR